MVTLAGAMVAFTAAAVVAVSGWWLVRRLARREAEKLLDWLPTPVFMRDAASRYRYVNEAFAEMFGRPRSSWIGRSVYETD